MTIEIFFAEDPRAALAFSGGTDSAYLLYAAMKCGAKVRAYNVKSAFQPRFEYEDAKRLAAELHADMKVIETDILSVPQIAANPADRCYYCKKRIFSLIADEARKDGFTLLIDGTNASDSEAERAGMRALREFSVRSPLRECGLTKEDVRRLSREAGLFTADKPAYACLATRIPAGEAITAEKLSITERAEDFLFGLGFSDFRVRMRGDNGVIQLPKAQMGMLAENREKIVTELKCYYKNLYLDLEARK